MWNEQTNGAQLVHGLCNYVTYTSQRVALSRVLPIYYPWLNASIRYEENQDSLSGLGISSLNLSDQFSSSRVGKMNDLCNGPISTI